MRVVGAPSPGVAWGSERRSGVRAWVRLALGAAVDPVPHSAAAAAAAAAAAVEGSYCAGRVRSGSAGYLVLAVCARPHHLLLLQTQNNTTHYFGNILSVYLNIGSKRCLQHSASMFHIFWGGGPLFVKLSDEYNGS